MAKSKKNNLEKRRKGIEFLFDIIFWFMLIITIEEIIEYIVGSNNLFSLLFVIIPLIIIFFCARLAHMGNIYAGIFGIVIGTFLFLLREIIFSIIGLLLVIDSIMYIMAYSKK